MIKIELKGVNELMERLDPLKVTAAARSALERTKSSAKSEAVRLIQKEWNISKRNIETKASGAERIKVSGKVNSDLTASLTFYSGGISLAYFGAKEFRLSVSQSKATAKRIGAAYVKGTKALVGIKVQIQKGKTTTLRQFFATVKFGKDKQGQHTGVFRSTYGRYKTGNRKMIESAAPGVGAMIKQPKTIEPLKVFVYDTFQKRLTHELKQRGLTD